MSRSSSSPIGVGVVGLSASGGWAANAHVPALAALEGYELRALSASSAGSAQAAGEKYGVPRTFGSAEELARCEEVDLVVVTVKVPHHRELVLPALEAGKTVLCEWPLGNGLAEAQELATAAEAKAVRSFVGLQGRSAPPIRYLRDLIAGGYVGDVLSTSIVASGRAWGATFGSGGEYLLDRDNGATMLTIPFGHTLDTFATVLGEFAEVNATTAVRRPWVGNTETGALAAMTAEDQVALTGTLQSGAVVSVHFRGGTYRGTNFRWEINGTEGDLVITGGTGHLQFGQVTLHGARGEQENVEELSVPADYDLVPGLIGHRNEMSYTVAHAYAQILADLTNGTQHVPNFAAAAGRQALLEEIQHSAASGQRRTLTRA